MALMLLTAQPQVRFVSFLRPYLPYVVVVEVPSLILVLGCPVSSITKSESVLLDFTGVSLQRPHVPSPTSWPHSVFLPQK